MAKTRLDFRLDDSIKSKIEKASALLGAKNLTEYIVKILDEKSTEIIKNHSNIKVENDIFDFFVDACENAKKPNKDLKEAFKFAKDKGF